MNETSNSSAAIMNGVIIKEELNGSDKYPARCSHLLTRIESIKLDNERLINHIYQVKKLVHKYRRQRRYLNKNNMLKKEFSNDILSLISFIVTY